VFGPVFSIDYFRDRSAELPVQTFSPRNSSVTARIISPDRAVGIRAGFENELDNYKTDEIEVTLGNVVDIENWEGVAYSAISNPSQVRERATFDLLQRDRRRREWQVETAIEGVVCQVGDLVSVVSDLFDDKSTGARIRTVIDASTLALDQSVLGSAGTSFAANPPIASLFSVGEKSIAFISTPTGMVQRNITALDGNVITLETALSSTADLVGAHVTITTVSNSTHRCFVTSIQRGNDETATLTLVDEAPMIWTEMQRLFG
jgi:hypothetical protein